MKLFVGNLSFKTTESALTELFSQYGTVSETFVALDRMTQRPRGFAFVTMSTAEEGQKAIDALNGQEFDGRTIAVNEARPPEARPPRRDFGSRPPRSGGGGYDRGGGGGGGYDRGSRGGYDRGGGGGGGRGGYDRGGRGGGDFERGGRDRGGYGRGGDEGW